jgi:hypothetical protein
MMREPSCLDLGPPEIQVALIRQHHTQFGIDTEDIQDNVSILLPCDTLQDSKVNPHTCSSKVWSRMAFAVK